MGNDDVYRDNHNHNHQLPAAIFSRLWLIVFVQEAQELLRSIAEERAPNGKRTRHTARAYVESGHERSIEMRRPQQAEAPAGTKSLY